MELVVGETVDPLVAELMKTLLIGCRQESQFNSSYIFRNRKARTLYGECLGELGAIDPSR